MSGSKTTQKQLIKEQNKLLLEACQDYFGGFAQFMITEHTNSITLKTITGKFPVLSSSSPVVGCTVIYFIADPLFHSVVRIIFTGSQDMRDIPIDSTNAHDVLKDLFDLETIKYVFEHPNEQKPMQEEVSGSNDRARIMWKLAADARRRDGHVADGKTKIESDLTDVMEIQFKFWNDSISGYNFISEKERKVIMRNSVMAAFQRVFPEEMLGKSGFSSSMQQTLLMLDRVLELSQPQ